MPGPDAVNSEKRAYTERYCAFIDIFGFTNLIGDIRRQQISFEHIRDLLKIVHEPTTFQTHTLDVRATSISDAIAISADFSPPSLAGLIDSVSRLSLAILEAGYFVRGGLCRGPLYHDQHMVFGEALINAYRLEATVARFPRIMVSKQVYDDALQSKERYLTARLSQSLDGPYFVHIMEEINIELVVLTSPDLTDSFKEAKLARFEKMRTNIENRLAEAADNPNHFEKAQWFARYWNDSISANEKRVRRVNGPDLDIVPWRRG